MKKKNNKKNNQNNVVIKLLKNKRNLIVASTILIVTIIIGAGIYSNVQKKNKNAKLAQQAQKIVLKDNIVLNFQTKKDIVLGDENAPITIIEYASLSCPHCANFYNDVFDKIDKEYIKKGKAKFIYRDFPLNQSAMLASMISLCHARNNNNNSNKYYKLIKALFKTQDSWAFTGNPFEKLRSLAKLDGMTSKQFDSCVNDKALTDEILQDRLQASKELKISSTPTFVMNGRVIGGYHNFNEFKKVIDEELNKVQ